MKLDTVNRIGTERLVPLGSLAPGTSAELVVPPDAHGLAVFAGFTGEWRAPSHDRFLARMLRRMGLATLLIDSQRSADVSGTPLAQRRSILEREAERILCILARLKQHPVTHALRVGCLGGSVGGAAALLSAAESPDEVGAVVARSSRLDAAADALPWVAAPTLLIVPARDTALVSDNRAALERLGAAQKRMHVVPGAGPGFTGPGALDVVALLSADWLHQHLSVESGTTTLPA